jgi:hypothetical protein
MPVGRRTRALVAVAGVGIPMLALGAQPAGALERTKTLSYVFTRGGQQVTCDVTGTSTIEYFSDTNQTDMTVTTTVTDSDPICHDPNVVRLTVAEGNYRRSSDEEEEVFFSVSSNDDSANARSIVNGTVNYLRGEHTVLFDCDNDPRRECYARLTTK